MDWYRLRHSIRLCTIRSAIKRANYLRKHNIFHQMGEKCMVMFRKIPLYPQLISIGDNVWIASNVSFITHDVIHAMLNNFVDDYKFRENIGCIEINDNVFIGANSTILYNVQIGSNTIIAAGSLVNKDLPGNGVWGGVPARYICSFEEYINKRKLAESVMVKSSKEALAEKTITACWKQFEHLKTGNDNYCIQRT